MFKAALPMLLPLGAYFCTALLAVIAHGHDQRRLRCARTVERCGIPKAPSGNKKSLP